MEVCVAQTSAWSVVVVAMCAVNVPRCDRVVAVAVVMMPRVVMARVVPVAGVVVFVWVYVGVVVTKSKIVRVSSRGRRVRRAMRVVTRVRVSVVVIVPYCWPAYVPPWPVMGVCAMWAVNIVRRVMMTSLS